MMCTNAPNSSAKQAVLPMSGAPTFDIEKKPEPGEFKTVMNELKVLVQTTELFSVYIAIYSSVMQSFPLVI